MSIFDNEAESFEMWMEDIRLFHRDEPEICRQKMIDLMCETLEKFGCNEGVEVFRKTMEEIKNDHPN